MYLNCHSWFSFKYGTLSPGDLFKEAKRNGVKKLVLTEINNTSSYVELLRICKENEDDHDLEIAVGIEFRKRSTHEFLYVGIAKNNKGFEELNRFLSFHNTEKKEFPQRPLPFSQAFIIYPYGKIKPEALNENEFIGVRIKDMKRFALRETYFEARDKHVILHPVTFAGEEGFAIHRILRAIDNNVVLTKLSPSQQADNVEYMASEKALEKKFEPLPGIAGNTRKLLDQCSLDLPLGIDRNKKSVTGNQESDWKELEVKAWQGFTKRYNASDPDLLERFNRELHIIQRKNFCSYYLIAYDLILFARTKGFDHVGRGSGANSLIAYCLGITNVDPIELNLYFERFLNEERATPPDFDIDFSWKDRDAVYEYLFERYGRDRTCLLGSYTTFHYNSIIREVGKVFGLPKEEIDILAEEPEKNKNRDKIAEKIFACASYMTDMPSHLSIHAGGVLITKDPIYNFTAVDLPPKDYPVSYLDMYSAEDFGIYKLDVLSQRGLGHIKDTVALVKKTRGVEVDVNRFEDFKKDEKVKHMLKNGRAMGCFYIESPAMRMLIAKLQCEDYLTLVAASSIIRPGVARSGMMKAYIERYHKDKRGEKYESIHPKMDELMKETFGVMVYQEDVIKVAHEFAGLSLTEADVLRRAMSGKYRARTAFDQVRAKFFYNCRTAGYEQKVADRVWFEIESFSGYSFAKGHSASYAVESYQSLFLKTYYPLEFMVSVINNFGGFYKTEFYFHEARMLGGKINAPCINHSDYNTTLITDHIYIGFVHIKSLEQKIAEQLVTEREQNGSYESLHDLLRRIPLKLEQAGILIQSGALRFTGKSKQTLRWEAMLYFSNIRQKHVESGMLFKEEVQSFDIPTLDIHPLQDAFDEIELLGFPLCDPFILLDTLDPGESSAATLADKIGQPVRITGYVVDIKHTHTKNGELMHFGAFYDKDGVFFDTVHFPNVARDYPFKGKGFYSITGKVVEDFSIPIVEVSNMKKIPMIDRNKQLTEVSIFEQEVS